MLSIWTVGTIVGCYLLALFALAFWGDKRLRDNRQHPILYSLGLGVHCTSWAFFGTTSQAAQYGWAVIPTYLGIMRAGMVAVPINHKFQMDTIEFILSDADCKVVFADEAPSSSVALKVTTVVPSDRLRLALVPVATTDPPTSH